MVRNSVGSKASLQRYQAIVQISRKLTEELGWNDNPARLNGFILKMFRVSRIEWLTVAQCYRLIEALKKILEREQEKEVDSDDKKETAYSAGER